MLGVTEALTDGDSDPDRDTLTDGDRDTDVLGVELGVALTLRLGLSDPESETLRLGDRDTLTLGESEAESDGLGLSDADIICPPTCDQTAAVLVPVFRYKLLPDLSKSLKKAPCLNPAYPSGSVFPSASKIRPFESSRTTSFV